jgi:plasmid stabilization system protein ParE
VKFAVRFTEEAVDDVERLYTFLLERTGGAFGPADDALEAIRRALAFLETSPFACRRVPAPGRHLRELLVGYGETGYVVLFAIDGAAITIAAVRHQREDDYR